MNRGDKETFYPNYPGSGLNEMGFCCGFLGNESSFDEDPDLNDQNDDQENTEYENEAGEVGGVAGEGEAPQPGKCGYWDFRNKVKQKKEELKAQYGKGKLNILACGIKPARISYNPIVKVPTTYWPGGGCGINPDLRPEYWHSPCLCGKGNCDDCKVGKDCCKSNQNKDADKLAAFSVFNECKNREGKVMTQGNEQAYDNATQRWNADMAVWHACDSQHPLWQPGWRREWRKFKKAGGLNQLKDECKVQMSGGTPPPPPPQNLDLQQDMVQQQKPTFDVSGMTCKQIADQFGIIPGKKWGTAPESVRLEWVSRGCTAAKVASGTDTVTDLTTETGRTIVPDDTEKNKKMIMIGVIAVVVIIAIALVVRAMRNNVNVK